MRILAVLLLVLGMAVGTARADRTKPQLVVAIASSHDESPDETDPAARDANRETIRQALLASLATSPQFTSIETKGLDTRHVDLTVVALHTTSRDNEVELAAQLKIVITDATGKILSVVTGGAKAEVSRHAFGRRLPMIKKQLLEDAMQGMFGPLRAHLLAS